MIEFTCAIPGCNGAQLAGPGLFCERHELAWLPSGEQKRLEEITTSGGPDARARCDLTVADFARRIEAQERNSK